MFNWLRDMVRHYLIRRDIKFPMDCVYLGKDLSDEDFEKYKESMVETLVENGVLCTRAAETWPEERVEPFAEQFIEGIMKAYMTWDVYKLPGQLLLKHGKPLVEKELKRDSEYIVTHWPLEKLLLLDIPERVRHTPCIVDSWYFEAIDMDHFLELTNSLTGRPDTAEQWSQVRDQRGLEHENAFGIWDQIVNEGRTWVLDLNKEQQLYVIRACTTFGGSEVDTAHPVNDCIQAYFSALETLKGGGGWSIDLLLFADAAWEATELTAVGEMGQAYCHLMDVQLSGNPLWYLRMPIDAMRACNDKEYELVEDAWQYANTREDKREFIEGFRSAAAQGKATSWAQTIITHFKEGETPIGGANYRAEAFRGVVTKK